MGSAASAPGDTGGDRGDGRLFAMASGLDGATGAYARAVDLFYDAEPRGAGNPWLARLQARADRLMTECRMRARLLAETPAGTLAAAAAKGQALRRYCEADDECDGGSLRVVRSLAADVVHLAAGQAAPTIAPGPPAADLPSPRPPCPRSRRR